MTLRSRLALLLLFAVPFLGRANTAEPSPSHEHHEPVPAAAHHDASPAPEHHDAPAVLHEGTQAAEHDHADDDHAPSPTAANDHHAAAPAASSHSGENDHGLRQGHPNSHDIATAPDNPTELTGAPLESLMRLGESQAATGDHEGAITAFYQVLENHAPPEMEVEALIGLAKAYQDLNERTRAVAILERLVKDHPGSPYAAKALLDAGRLHRSLGADRLALSRFYSVLQATLRIPDQTWVDRYRQLARTAQYEIAETHLRAGRYEEAERYFNRFALLELAPTDRALGAFKVIEARSAAGRHEAVVSGVNEFIDQYPRDRHVPAALHHATTALRELGRADDALAHTLHLLQASREEQSGDPSAWAYWQRRTGNELANTFFQRGEFANARQIYDTLASLDGDAEWRLPASYQAALCRERLGMTEEAIAMYRDIVASITEAESIGLQEIGEMASWRITHLEDLERERADISLLINSLPPEGQTHTASNP